MVLLEWARAQEVQRLLRLEQWDRVCSRVWRHGRETPPKQLGTVVTELSVFSYRMIELLTLVADLFIHLVTSKTIFASQFASLEDGENRPRNDGIKEIHFFFSFSWVYSGALLGNGAASVRSFITTPSWTPSPILIYEIKMYRRNCRWPQLSHLCVKMYLWIDREMENCRVPFIFTQPSQCPIPVFWVFALSGMLPHPLPTPSHHTHAPSNSTLKIPLIFYDKLILQDSTKDIPYFTQFKKLPPPYAYNKK